MHKTFLLRNRVLDLSTCTVCLYSSRYGFYGGPPYKRQRRLSEDDVGQHTMTYGPSYYDPPYARHQVGN